MAVHASVKHVQIDKAQSAMLATVAIAVIVAIFSLFGIKAMISKGAYQRRVINEKHRIVSQLKSNYTAANALSAEFAIFDGQDPNIIGGSTKGTGNQDGANSQIILDALPSTYDTPALASSIEKLLAGNSVNIRSIDVKDDPTSNPDAAQSLPISSPMAFSFEGSTTYKSGQQVLKDFERSIRPFDVTNLELNGSDANLVMLVNMTTYYQPAKSLSLTTTKAVK